jgi:hypothetical protein
LAYEQTKQGCYPNCDGVKAIPLVSFAHAVVPNYYNRSKIIVYKKSDCPKNIIIFIYVPITFIMSILADGVFKAD